MYYVGEKMEYKDWRHIFKLDPAKEIDAESSGKDL